MQNVEHEPIYMCSYMHMHMHMSCAVHIRALCYYPSDTLRVLRTKPFETRVFGCDEVDRHHWQFKTNVVFFRVRSYVSPSMMIGHNVQSFYMIPADN